jgi:HEAT repeat protein
VVDQTEIHRLAQSKDVKERKRAVEELKNNFSILPAESKKQAWDDLHRLTQDKGDSVRRDAIESLGVCYSHLPDESKKQAWDDLHRLTQDKDDDVRQYASDSLGVCYSHLPAESRNQAWDDLHRLTQDKDGDVRWGASDSLGVCYSHLPAESRNQAWDDLHRLTQDKDDFVRRGAIESLGVCYSHLPAESRNQAWDDLHRFTQDKEEMVRIAANHSSGMISIYWASQAKSDELVEKELEKALKFFEKSSTESTYFNPAKFCLPFYRSFYIITFRKENAEAEVKKYLADAKKAVEGSKSKENLLEAVENLGNALKEAKKARDLNDVKCNLNTYRLYFERAAYMLDEAEGKTPGASRLVRRGLPIIDESIKGIIAEIQEKAKTLCKQVKDTDYKEIGQQVNNVGQELSKVINPIRLEREVRRMLIPITAMCKKMPEEDRGEACDILKQINDEQNVEDKLSLINMFLSKISTQMNQKNDSNMEKIENKQIIIGNGNIIGEGNKQDQSSKSPPEKNSKKPHKLEKSWIDILNSSATIAAFIGFLAVEIGTYFYPLSYNHLISVVVAAISLTIVAMLNRR